MSHTEYRITADAAAQEILIAQLSEAGASGFEEREGELLAYFDEGYDAANVQDLLKGFSYTTGILEQRNWNAVWESAFEPVRVGNFCGIRAHFHSPMRDVAHDLLITPKMSFGTGHHATTYLMVEPMQDLNFRGKRVFDFGTGTGVLAILAEKLGAREVTAIDVDEWSIENAAENTRLNGCQRVRVHLSSAPPPGESFDTVLANINRNVLLKCMPAIRKCVRGEGVLLLSGILPADEQDIVESCVQNGFKKINSRERNGWMMVQCKAN